VNVPFSTQDDLILPSREEVERTAKKQALLVKAREAASRAAALRESCSTWEEADALRRELHALVGVFQAKRIEALECLAEERRIEVRIGELLGPPLTPEDQRQADGTFGSPSLPGNDGGRDGLNDRWKCSGVAQFSSRLSKVSCSRLESVRAGEEVTLSPLLWGLPCGAGRGGT
jgi:hypothetical protein